MCGSFSGSDTNWSAKSFPHRKRAREAVYACAMLILVAASARARASYDVRSTKVRKRASVTDRVPASRFLVADIVEITGRLRSHITRPHVELSVVARNAQTLSWRQTPRCGPTGHQGNKRELGICCTDGVSMHQFVITPLECKLVVDGRTLLRSAGLRQRQPGHSELSGGARYTRQPAHPSPPRPPPPPPVADKTDPEYRSMRSGSEVSPVLRGSFEFVLVRAASARVFYWRIFLD
jgi:hypothetical protein